MIIPYFTLSLILPAALAAGSVCSSGLYAILLPLSAYPPAQSYCSSHFPPSTVTSTSTAPGSTSTVVSTTTIPPMKKKLKRHTTSPTPSPTPKKTPPPTKPTPTPADPQASLFSILVAEAEAVVSTLCSCIETPVTVKTTVTPSPTTVTTTTTTTSTIQAYVTCADVQPAYYDIDGDGDYECPNNIGPNGNPCQCAYYASTGSGVCEYSEYPLEYCRTDADCSYGRLCLGYSSEEGYQYTCSDTAPCINS